MKDYEVKVTYEGYIMLEAANEEEAIKQARETFGEETGSWEMAKYAEYEIEGKPQHSVWKSEITTEMVTSLNEQEISLLVKSLNDTVQEICENWGMK